VLLSPSTLLSTSEDVDIDLSPVETLWTLLRRFVGERPYVCARGFFCEDDAASEVEEEEAVGMLMWRVGGRGVVDAGEEGEEEGSDG